jgi:filamentous hemagglutinin family protein
VQKVLSPLLQIGLCTLGYLYATSEMSLAQVTTDGTVNTQVTINGKVSEITGGETRGGNLFHSFQEFSVGTGNEAFFNNANNISNILSRVTGGNISNIDGLIRANGSASLFLINPAGIIFGEGARLDIGGSFLGSTADSILFPEGEFSATDLPTPPLLTINAPIGLRLRETAGEIVVRGTGNNLSFDRDYFTFSQGETPPGLQVESGETLALVGNGVKLEGGNLLADGGRIEIGSINSPSLVNLIAKEGGWTLDYPDAVSFQDIELSDRASIDVSSTRGSGSVQAQGKNLTLDGGSAIFAFTGSESGGTIQINTSDSIEVTGVASALYTAVSPDGMAKGGDLTLATDRLIARDGAQIGADTYGLGSAGIITVQADESVLLSGTSVDNVPSALGTFVQAKATGSGSQLNLETKRLTIEDGAQLITATLSDGSGATLTAKVSSVAEIRGTAADDEESPSAISSVVDLVSDTDPPTGDGGKINLEAGKLIVRDGAQVTVSNEGLGDAGDINIVSPSIELSDSGNIVADTASGQGGNITLQTSNLLSLDSQSRISATAGGTGDGGNIKLDIDDTIKLSNSSQISAGATGDGNGGNIDIDTTFIIAPSNQNSDIIASAKQGTGGKITIDAEGIFGLQVRPQSDFTNDIDASGGVDGEVIINTPDVDITKGFVENTQNVVEPEQTAAQACAANYNTAAKNGLTIGGKGGVPPEPGLPLNSQNISINGEINPTSTIPEPIETSVGKIQPARGIKITKDGRVTLTAYRTNNAGERVLEIKPNCN